MIIKRPITALLAELQDIDEQPGGIEAKRSLSEGAYPRKAATQGTSNVRDHTRIDVVER